MALSLHRAQLFAASAQLQSGLLVGLVLRHRRSAVVVMQSADATCCWRLARSTCGRWAAFQEAVVVTLLRERISMILSGESVSPGTSFVSQHDVKR